VALINCAECSKQVSTEASTCPNCGAPVKGVQFSQPALSAGRSVAKGLSGIHILGIVFFGLIGVLVLFAAIFAPAKNDVSEPQKSTNNLVSGQNVVKRSFFACQTEQAFRQIFQYWVDKDEALYRATLSRQLGTGMCMVPGLETVYYVDDYKAGLVNIRFPGETSTYWTVLEIGKK
jgi:hypothetical protein